MRIYSAYFKKILTSPVFYLSITGVMAICLMGTNGKGYVVNSFFALLNINSYRNLIVLFAAFPFGSAYCRELNEKSAYYIINRSSVFSHLMSYIIVEMIVSFLVVFLGMFFSIFIMNFTFENFIDTSYQPKGAFLQFMNQKQCWLFLFIVIYHYSISVSAWSVAGLAMSSVFTNSYIAICSPLVLSYTFELLTIESKILPDLWQLSLSSTTISQSPLICSIYITLIFLILACIFALVFYNIAKRRIQCEIT